MDANFLGSPEGNLDRSNSEPDIVAASIRPRTCSNLSLRRPSKAGSKSTKKRPDSLTPQKSMDSESELAHSTSTFNSGATRNGRMTPTREEVKALAYERLQTELHKAQQELKLKDEQCDKLSRVRNQLESELEELTACLFQEAHAMVHEAKLKQDLAEKKNIEANNKVDMLQAEVNALKSLVITSTPGNTKGRHRRHSDNDLSPCEDCGSCDCDGAVPKNAGRCKAKRSRDYHNPKKPEVDVITFREFLQFMDELSVSHDQPFLNRIYQENVAPCLEFTNRELAAAVHRAIKNNVLSMETIRTKPIFRKCALTGATRYCQHRVKLADNEDWINICRNSRNRIAAVCDFYTYIRYIQSGLVKADATEIYWEIMRLRNRMNEARLGLLGQQPTT